MPSEQDYAATLTVRESLRTVGVELLDHFVVADNDFVSIASGGFLDAATEHMRK